MIGAVVLQQRADECMDYLSYLLGWEIPNTDFQVNVGNDYKKREELSENIQQELKRLTTTDIKLFAAVLDRVEEQIKHYESSPHLTLPAYY